MKIERIKEISQQGALAAISASLTDELLAIGGADGSVKVFDVSNRPKLLANLQGHQKCINALRWSPGNLLASASSDGTVRIWRNLGPLHTLRGHSLDVTDTFWASDSLLVSCSLDGQIFLWDAVAGDKLRNLGNASGGVKGLAGYGSTSFAIASDGAIWSNVDGKTSVKNLRRDDPRNFKDSPRDVAYSRRPSADLKSSELAVPYGQRSKRHLAVILSSTDSRTLRSLRGHRTRITSVSFSPWLYDFGTVRKAALLAVVSQDGTLSIWQDATKPLLVLSGLVDDSSVITDVTWRSKHVFLCASDGAVTRVSLSDLPGESCLRPELILHGQRNFSRPTETFGASGKRRVAPDVVGITTKRSRVELPLQLTACTWQVDNSPGAASTLTRGGLVETLSGGCYLFCALADYAAACLQVTTSEQPFYSIRVWSGLTTREWASCRVSLAQFTGNFLAIVSRSKIELFEFPVVARRFFADIPDDLDVCEIILADGILTLRVSGNRELRWDTDLQSFLVSNN